MSAAGRSVPARGCTMIYNRQTIALLMRLCKLISGEFGVRLHLDDPQIISKLRGLLAGGGSPEVITVWRSVLEQVGEEELPTPVAAPHRVYRGQAVPEPERSLAAPEAAAPAAERPRSVRIYRGQIVN